MLANTEVSCTCRTIALCFLLMAVCGCSSETATQGKVTIPDSKVFAKTKATKSPPAHAPTQ